MVKLCIYHGLSDVIPIIIHSPFFYAFSHIVFGYVNSKAKAGLDWELLFLETEDLFPKKYCFESNEKKC